LSRAEIVPQGSEQAAPETLREVALEKLLPILRQYGRQIGIRIASCRVRATKVLEVIKRIRD
jgi:hypothetical protein